MEEHADDGHHCEAGGRPYAIVRWLSLVLCPARHPIHFYITVSNCSCSKWYNHLIITVLSSNQHANTTTHNRLPYIQHHDALTTSRDNTSRPPKSRSPRTREGKVLPPPRLSAQDAEARRGGERQQTNNQREGRQNIQSKNHCQTKGGTPKEEHQKSKSREDNMLKRTVQPESQFLIQKFCTWENKHRPQPSQLAQRPSSRAKTPSMGKYQG